jgi:hypothetical protein
MTVIAHRLIVCLGALALSGCVTTGDGSAARFNLGPATPPVLEPLPFNAEQTVYATASLRANDKPTRDSLDASVRMQSDKVEAEVRDGAARIRDPELNTYVSGIVCKLAGPYCGEIRTYVVRNADFNATMMANGTMQVWSGLLLRVHNESQLATVLGHEIGHYIQRHTIQRTEDAYKKTNAAMFLRMALAGAGVGIAGIATDVALYSSMMSFGREQETEADDIAMRLLAQHNYDPTQAAKMWENVAAESKADIKNPRPSLFWATHPSPENRSNRLTRQALFATQITRERDIGIQRYRRAVGPHIASFLHDELQLRRFERFEVVLANLTREGYAPGLIGFYRGELHRIRNTGNDNDLAIDAYVEAASAPDHPMGLYRSLGQVYLRLGYKDEGRLQLQKYLELVPDASDRGIIEMMVMG